MDLCSSFGACSIGIQVLLQDVGKPYWLPYDPIIRGDHSLMGVSASRFSKRARISEGCCRCRENPHPPRSPWSSSTALLTPGIATTSMGSWPP